MSRRPVEVVAMAALVLAGCAWVVAVALVVAMLIE